MDRFLSSSAISEVQKDNLNKELLEEVLNFSTTTSVAIREIIGASDKKVEKDPTLKRPRIIADYFRYYRLVNGKSTNQVRKSRNIII